MQTRRGTILGGAARAVLAAGATLAVLAPQANAESAGRVQFERNATSSFAIPWITQSTPVQRGWMHATYARMRGYPPFHDQALPWGPPTDFYQDLYAIYRDVPADQALMQQHPNWVLRDASGNRMFIPWACSGGTCPAYAADIGNPQWREHWIAQARAELAKGYEGVFIDNVNMDLMVGTGQGTISRPMDQRTGAPMTDANWRRYVAEFTEQIRAELPEALITHNAGQWWVSHSDPYYRREVQAADRIELERGFSDPGLAAGTGTYGYETMLAHAEWVHAQGADFVSESYNLDPARAEFELASYLLVSNGGDSLATDWRANPDNWWSGWSTDLGAPVGPRQTQNGVLRREFAHGIALLNPPGAPTRTVELPVERSWTRQDGTPVTTVTLTARQAVVLGGAAPPPPPPPPPDPEPEPEPNPDPDPEPSPNPDPSPPPATEPSQVTLKPSKHRVHRGKRVVLRGVAPSADTVEIVELHGGRWTTKVVDTDGEGGYRLRLRARSAGLHRFHARANGLHDSRSVRVRVKG